MNIYADFRKEIDEMVNGIDTALRQGKAANYEEYLKMSSRIRGLEEACDILKRTLKMYMEDDDE